MLVDTYNKINGLIQMLNKLLINLCNQLIIGKSKAITTLSLWLNYLYIENRNADINKLKENV